MIEMDLLGFLKSSSSSLSNSCALLIVLWGSVDIRCNSPGQVHFGTRRRPIHWLSFPTAPIPTVSLPARPPSSIATERQNSYRGGGNYNKTRVTGTTGKIVAANKK